MMRFGFNFNYFKAFKHTAWLIGSNRPLLLVVVLIQLVVSWLLFSLLNSSLFYFYMWIVGWNFSFFHQAQLDVGVVIAMTFFAAFSLFLIFGLFFTALSFTFYSLLEINEANSLMQRIEHIGLGRKIRGMARE